MPACVLHLTVSVFAAAEHQSLWKTSELTHNLFSKPQFSHSCLILYTFCLKHTLMGMQLCSWRKVGAHVPHVNCRISTICWFMVTAKYVPYPSQFVVSKFPAVSQMFHLKWHSCSSFYFIFSCAHTFWLCFALECSFFKDVFHASKLGILDGFKCSEL